MAGLDSCKQRARQLKSDTMALVLAYRDPRTSWGARLVAALVIGYAFSPIDLIPDFIPVLGYLDDLILIPLGVALAVRLIPPEVMTRARLRAQEEADRPVSRAAAMIVVLIWIGLAALVLRGLAGILG